ncbi:MAG TPA: PQQ-binding-like beta-propeller repeat protein [Gemmataceae bacterium]|nr:PQQ-binding-like beta-propeller repeat protein [Gemmataceae bacterium]
MKRVFLPLTVVALASAYLAFSPALAHGQNPPPQQAPSPLPQQVRRPGPPPEVSAPVPFRSPDGKITGWKVVLPGGRPLATPAVVDGKVFIGGGFGSHEFYAFDAATGKKLWQHQTGDDGPTAAVVQDGCVAFNTESCELEVLTVDGRPLWKKWLGDPLMSMPAIDRGRVYMAFPNSRGDRQHYLACFELKTGKEIWRKPIAGEIITAPVIENEMVYLATLEGSLYCFQQNDGTLVWKEQKNATSSPVVWNGYCYFSRREEVTAKKGGKDIKQQTERITGRGVGPREPIKDLPATIRAADYLDYSKRMASPNEKLNQTYDNSVGFAQGKGDAKIEQAITNLGQASVAGIWAYQGSKPFLSGGRLYSCMGDTLKCVDPRTEQVIWRKALGRKEPNAELLDSVLTPPALVNNKVFVGTIDGEVYCLSAGTGEVLWSVRLGEPIVFQPAVARGRVYVSTSKGSLFCLETGDPKDDGWLMWGATAGHNGLTK